MRFFPLKLPAFNSLLGVAARRGDGCRALRRRKAVFEALSPRAMLSGHGLSGHMVSAHSAALHFNSSPGAQPAIVSSASHPSIAAVSSSPHTGPASKGALLHSGAGYSGGSTMFSSAGTLSILASLSNYAGGTLQLTVANNYAGETPVLGGTLNLSGTGTLILNSPTGTYPGATTVIGGTINLNTGSTTNGVVLQTVQASPTQPLTGTGTIASNSILNSGTLTLSGGTLMPISGTTAFNGTDSDTRPIVSTGTGTFDEGTLELAGTVSDLSNPSPGACRVQVINNSVLDLPRPTPGGEFDSRPIIDGSSLTANHIVQGALVIDRTNPGASTVTISASDPSGNPLASGLTPAVSLALAASAAPAPFGLTTLTTSGDSPSDAV